jgi:hypothetical protein
MNVTRWKNTTETRSRKRWAIRGLIVVGCYSLLTGGLCYFDTTSFGNAVRLDVENPPLSRIDVQPRETEICVPLFFHYRGFKKPYRLTMYVFDKHKSFSRIELDGVTLELEDGEVLQGMRNWQREIKDGDWYGGPASSGGLFITHQVLDVELPRTVSFSIVWKGRLQQKSGEVVPLSQRAFHEVRPAFSVVPYWLVLYGHTQA